MPIYIRKRGSPATPDTATDTTEDNNDDFLQDPDQRWDSLPQPFRFINKILINIYNEAWEIISSRDSERIREATRIRPPRCICQPCATALEDYGSILSICSVLGGGYIVVAVPAHLVVIDAKTQETVALLKQKNLHVVEMTATSFEENTALICTIDDMGCARLFFFSNGSIYLVQTINEQDSGSKTHVTLFRPSKGGDYYGVCLENPVSKDICVEVYKTPRESWEKEIESAMTKSSKQNSNTHKASSPQSEPEGETEGDTDQASEKLTDRTSPEPPDSNRQQPEHYVQTGASTSHKFALSTLVLRVKPPDTIQGVTWSSPMQLSKTVDMGEVIGTGVNHLISHQHLEARLTAFKQQHNIGMNGDSAYEKEQLVQPTLQFLKPGKLLPFNLDKNFCSEHRNIIMITWTGYNQIHYFNLLKTGKDVEHKPDFVAPASAPVTTSTISTCCTLLAYATKTRTVTVLDVATGLKRRSVYIQDDVEQLMFLDPGICPQETNEMFRPYSSSSVHLLVWCKGYRLFLVNCGITCTDSLVEISANLAETNEVYTHLTPIMNAPELLLAWRSSNRVYVHNVATGQVLTEIGLPSGYQFSNPCHPIAAYSPSTSSFYVSGKCKNTETSDETILHKLFMLPLSHFPTLNNFLTKQHPKVELQVQSSVEDRTNYHLICRMQDLSERQARIKNKWVNMRREYSTVLKMRKQNEINPVLLSMIKSP